MAAARARLDERRSAVLALLERTREELSLPRAPRPVRLARARGALTAAGMRGHSYGIAAESAAAAAAACLRSSWDGSVSLKTASTTGSVSHLTKTIYTAPRTFAANSAGKKPAAQVSVTGAGAQQVATRITTKPSNLKPAANQTLFKSGLPSQPPPATGTASLKSSHTSSRVRPVSAPSRSSLSVAKASESASTVQSLVDPFRCSNQQLSQHMTSKVKAITATGAISGISTSAQAEGAPDSSSEMDSTQPVGLEQIPTVAHDTDAGTGVVDNCTTSISGNTALETKPASSDSSEAPVQLRNSMDIFCDDSVKTHSMQTSAYVLQPTEPIVDSAAAAAAAVVQTT